MTTQVPASHSPSTNPFEELFDDREQIEEEAALDASLENINSLEDLETLLEESVTLHKAKRAKAQGRRLDPDQLDAIARARLMEEVEVWQTEAEIAVNEQRTCTYCHSVSSMFLGWYAAQRHRRNHSARLTLVAKPTVAREWLRQHWVISSIEGCCDCLPTLRVASVAEFPLLSSLGSHVREGDEVQSVLELSPATPQLSVVSDALLEELSHA